MATYAWSDIYVGGETMEVRDRKIIVSRNIIARGDKVTKGDIRKFDKEFSDEEWDNLVENGSIRDYPLPEDLRDGESPSEAITRRLYSGGEIDQNMLLELSLKHPPALNPPSEEAAEVEAPKGV